jgi:hypothetical protein
LGISFCTTTRCERSKECWRAIGKSPNPQNQSYADLSYVCIHDDYHFFSEVDGREVRVLEVEKIEAKTETTIEEVGEVEA